MKNKLLAPALALCIPATIAIAQPPGQLVSGYDYANSKTHQVNVDAMGRLEVIGTATGGSVFGNNASGTAPTQPPVFVGGWDGTLVRSFLTDTSGHAIVNINGTPNVAVTSSVLPTGASTAAKQPAIGTSGTPSTDVLSVQGTATMQPFQIGGVTATTVASGMNQLPVGLTSTTGAILVTSATNNDSITPTAAASSQAAINVGSYTRSYNGSAYDRVRTIQGSDQTGLGILGVSIAPNSNANSAIDPIVSTTLESSHIFKASAGNLYRVAITTGAVQGYLLIFDAVSAPADGAVTPNLCRVIPSNSSVEIDHSTIPERYTTGITAVFSSTGCFTKTASATAMFEGDVE